MSSDNAPFVFNTPVDRSLRVLFNAAAAHMVWNRYYEGTTCEKFFNSLNDRFDEYVNYLQDTTIEIVAEMFHTRALLPPHVTIEDIFRFFNHLDPLYQLYRHQASRRHLRYAIRCCYIRWMGRREEVTM